MYLSGKKILLINLSFLVRVRIFNVIMLILAMYVSAIFLFGDEKDIIENFKNIKLHGIILSSSLSAMAGYIINFFYDQEKDMVYRPISSIIQRFISNGIALRFYIFFNSISLTIAALLSYRIFIFFLVYQFIIWFYSHKLSRIVFINNLTNSALLLFPFLALFLYYENFSSYIIYLSEFLFIMVLIKDICKDLLSFKYDDLFNYNTLPNTLGIIPTKIILNILICILIFISIHLTFEPHLYEIRLYYLLTALLSLGSIISIWITKSEYMQILIFMIKFWIFLGTISLLFIDGNPLTLHF
ncbi:UbiA family prenyltransferase [Apibacter sp.]|uniref:UbiA family prenyltransferase n=1 Tax=Apibacter sp. TaxID=2023709 RepID=UPI0025F4C59E|nr:UbiA family prenyltransferase [Apibacter sp.]MCT6869753.1 UbiA family prenyltransferase [Apibacter sp.]